MLYLFFGQVTLAHIQSSPSSKVIELADSLIKQDPKQLLAVSVEVQQRFDKEPDGFTATRYLMWLRDHAPLSHLHHMSSSIVQHWFRESYPYAVNAWFVFIQSLLVDKNKGEWNRHIVPELILHFDKIVLDEVLFSLLAILPTICQKKFAILLLK